MTQPTPPLTSSYRAGVVELPLRDLYPWTICPNGTNQGLAEEIRRDGMTHPLIVVRFTGYQWYTETRFGEKVWKLPLLEALGRPLPGRDADEVLTVRVGNQRYHIAVEDGYDSVSCLVFDTVNEALHEWKRIRAEVMCT